jgi:hypothetical protein
MTYVNEPRQAGFEFIVEIARGFDNSSIPVVVAKR